MTETIPILATQTAGRIVVAHHLGMKIGGAWVVANSDASVDLSHFNEASPEALRARLIVSMAGAAVDRICRERGSLPLLSLTAEETAELSRLASRLQFKRSDADEAIACEGEARAILRGHWAAVERIAMALAEDGILSGGVIAGLAEVGT